MVGHQKEGWGTEFCTRGKIIYVGNWHKGKRHGHGTHTQYKGNKPSVRYTGEWKEGQKEGYGVQESYIKLEHKDAWLTKVLDGNWKEGKFHGWGRELEYEELDELLGLASGVESTLRYEGTWLENLRDGVGIAIYPNGDRFEGIWRKGLRHGRGRFWYANSNSCLEGQWVDDVFKSGTLTSCVNDEDLE